MMNDLAKADLTMKLLAAAGYPISRSAVFIAIEDDVITEERPFSEYLLAIRIWGALHNNTLETEKERDEALLEIVSEVNGGVAEKIRIEWENSF